MSTVESALVPETVAHAHDEDQELLLGLIFGAMHEKEILTAADFAAKIAVCAKMSAGNPNEYGRVVKRILIRHEPILQIFEGTDIQQQILRFLRATRRTRNCDETLQWLAAQFLEPQDPETVRLYLVEVERVLANALIVGSVEDCRKYGRV